MDEDKKFSIEDNINLDEIRMLLGEQRQSDDQRDQIADAPKSETSQNTAAGNEEKEFTEASVMKPEIPAKETGHSENFKEKPEAEPETAKQVPAGKRRKKEAGQAGTGEKESFTYELYGMLHDVIYLLVAVTLVFVFVIRLVGVKGESMLPTLHNADFLLLESNFLYHGDDLKYGDVIVISAPYFEERGEGPIVKRVIATEGQTINIDFDKGLVYVDGVLLQESYINEPTYSNWDGENGLEYPAKVPEGCVFVMGDNRNNSLDSRFAPVGMIQEEDVLGKVLFIVLPGETRNDAGEVTDARDWSRFGLVS